MKKGLIDKVYVLSVKSFSDRILHIQKEMEKHHIDFEFNFNYDIPEIESSIYEDFDQYLLSKAKISLILKHIDTWQDAVKKGYKKILVLEDDVILAKNFSNKFQNVLLNSNDIPSKNLIFLGGATHRLPKGLLTSKKLLVEFPLPTTEAYITDISACQSRLDWLKESKLKGYKINLPADHLVNYIDNRCGIKDYWVRTAIVEQGSMTGTFRSLLDSNRIKHSNLYNISRYNWLLFCRKVRRGFFDLMY
jgi:glycosyl transferase family 25